MPHPCWSCVCIGIVWQRHFHGVALAGYLNQSKSSANLEPHELQRLTNQYAIMTPNSMPCAIMLPTQLMHAMCALFVRQTQRQPM